MNYRWLFDQVSKLALLNASLRAGLGFVSLQLDLDGQTPQPNPQTFDLKNNDYWVIRSAQSAFKAFTSLSASETLIVSSTLLGYKSGANSFYKTAAIATTTAFLYTMRYNDLQEKEELQAYGRLAAKLNYYAEHQGELTTESQQLLAALNTVPRSPIAPDALLDNVENLVFMYAPRTLVGATFKVINDGFSFNAQFSHWSPALCLWLGFGAGLSRKINYQIDAINKNLSNVTGPISLEDMQVAVAYLQLANDEQHTSPYITKAAKLIADLTYLYISEFGLPLAQHIEPLSQSSQAKAHELFSNSTALQEFAHNITPVPADSRPFYTNVLEMLIDNPTTSHTVHDEH